MIQFTSRGFTLVETVIATAVLITALAGIAQLFALSARFVRDSNRTNAAVVAAQDKLEMLGALRFGYDDDGRPATDTRLHATRQTSLYENVESYFDWLQDDGSAGPERGASFVRRWRITPIAATEPATIAIDVCVYSTRTFNSGPEHAEACLGSIRVRQP